MGFGMLAAQMLEYARVQSADFSSILTLGRQSFDISENRLKAFYRDTRSRIPFDKIPEIKLGVFCEPFFQAVYHAQITDSIDNSDFEKASIVQDMNLPYEFKTKYSLVLDFGCLEHIFNFPVAIDNVIRACKTDGHIIHIIPANNYCGHGFYQYSPELFYSLYSAERGFADTTVFLVQNNKPNTWYRVASPLEIQNRINVTSNHQLSLLVMTRKTQDAKFTSDKHPQQSDYIQKWAHTNSQSQRSQLKQMAIQWKVHGILRSMEQCINTYKHHISTPRSDLKPFKIRKILQASNAS